VDTDGFLWGGYFTKALITAIFMRKYSCKAGILTGLALDATDAILFYLVVITEKFWFFCRGLYVLTFNLAVFRNS
jgi:FHS family L-fucose permease-like MFS transporter